MSGRRASDRAHGEGNPAVLDAGWGSCPRHRSASGLGQAAPPVAGRRLRTSQHRWIRAGAGRGHPISDDARIHNESLGVEHVGPSKQSPLLSLNGLREGSPTHLPVRPATCVSACRAITKSTTSASTRTSPRVSGSPRSARCTRSGSAWRSPARRTCPSRAAHRWSPTTLAPFRSTR